MAVSVTEIGVAVGGRVAKPVKAHSTWVAPVNPNPVMVICCPPLTSPVWDESFCTTGAL